MIKAQHVQFSYFAANANAASASRIFEHAFQMEPDVAQSNKTPSPENPFYSVAESRIDLSEEQINGRIQIQPGRLDIVFTPVSATGTDSLPLLNPLELYEAISADIIGEFVDSLKVFRLSTFAQLAKSFKDQADANAFLLAQAGMGGQFADTTDFILQFNRRRPFAGDNRRWMNRLFRLTETAVQQVDLVLSGTELPQTSTALVHYLAGVLIDVNSVPDGTFYPRQTADLFMNELVEEIVRLIRSESPAKALYA